MGIDSDSDIAANLQVAPTSVGMVRIYISGDGFDLPMDFEPEEALEIAEELRVAAERAREIAAAAARQTQAAPKAAKGDPATPRAPALPADAPKGAAPGRPGPDRSPSPPRPGGVRTKGRR